MQHTEHTRQLILSGQLAVGITTEGITDHQAKNYTHHL